MIFTGLLHRSAILSAWFNIACCWHMLVASRASSIEKAAVPSIPRCGQQSVKTGAKVAEFDAIKIKSIGMASNKIVSISNFQVTRREDVVYIEAEICNLTSEALSGVRLAPGYALDERKELIPFYTLESRTVTVKSGERVKGVLAIRTPSRKCNLRAQVVYKGSQGSLMFTVELDVPPDEKADTRIYRRIDY